MPDGARHVPGPARTDELFPLVNGPGGQSERRPPRDSSVIGSTRLAAGNDRTRKSLVLSAECLVRPWSMVPGPFGLRTQDRGLRTDQAPRTKDGREAPWRSLRFSRFCVVLQKRLLRVVIVGRSAGQP